MCGIAGIYTDGRPVAQESLRAMGAALAHRGPDATGFAAMGPAALVHTRLSIIDLEGGAQPMTLPEAGLSLVANGEIYNYIELRSELAALGCVFATSSDSEVILHGYRVWGREVVKRLHGMFAFAIHDAGRGELFLGRDRLGIKPLFYARKGDLFCFASEIKGILPALPQAPEIHPPALAQYLENQFSSGEQTVFKGILRLLPGHFLVVDDKLGCSTTRYWSALEVAPVRMEEAEALERFESLMSQVMTEHVRSDVPYGLYLSGGTDSAVLLGLLRRFQDKPVRTFSIGYENSRMSDELGEAEYIAAHFGARHTSYRLSREEIFAQLPRSIWVADELMRDYAGLPTSILAQRSSRELKVVFSGEGGDEVFAGYRRYRNSPVENCFKALLVPGTGGFRTRGQFGRSLAKRIYGSELLEARRSFREPFVEAFRQAPKGWSAIRKRQYCDLVTALPDNLLVKADRMLMGYGVEGRVPFLDHRVVEFGLALPDALKIRGKTGKYFLKKWAQSFIPKEHLYRSKKGFYVPVKEWLGEEFIRSLEPRLLANEGIRAWFRPDGVRELLARQRSKADRSREVWSLMQFAIWHRMFIEGQGSVPGGLEQVLDWV